MIENKDISPSLRHVMEKDDIERIIDDYFEGRTTQEEYGAQIIEFIKLRQRNLSGIPNKQTNQRSQ